jgi:Domain of unknown function (DUF1996)
VFLAVALAATVGLGVSIASAHPGGGQNASWGWGWRHHPKPQPTKPTSSAPTQPSSSAPSSGPTDTGSSSPSDSGSPTDSSSSNPGDGGGAGGGGTADPNDPDGDGPLTAADYSSIRNAGRIAAAPRAGRNASRGTFVSQCGRNQNGHHNSANYIVAPGVSNGAHHIHDYVGNLTTDANSTDQSLAAAGTTCSNQGDKSPYVWPVLRDITKQGTDPDKDGGGLDGNFGKIIVPSIVTLQFRGNAQSKVVAMPQFLRAITGDAKAAVVNAPSKNARAQWSCQNAPGRAFTDKFPLCTGGSLVIRTEDLPSCWDGVNLDAANHRDHLVFPDAATGACPANTKAVPQLHVTLGFRVPAGRSFALDTFPSELRKPITDHFDFENVMSVALMNRVVNCINVGRTC